MAKVVERRAREPGSPLIICDFSPPRGASPELLEAARTLDADYLAIAYNPGKSVRVNSAATAQWIRANTGTDVVFNLATRDMNKLALQSLLLGAQLMGLENVVVLKGDDFNERDLAVQSGVGDFTPTELIRSISQMNEGVDFRDRKLRHPTDFCIGATIDLGRDVEAEVELTHRKVEAGAQFFVAQPTFDPAEPTVFLERYAQLYAGEPPTLVFHGIQVMAPESIVFGGVPQWVTDDLAGGRPGRDIALQVLDRFTEAGFQTFYLVPPILRGGRRDYEAAQAVLTAFRSRA